MKEALELIQRKLDEYQVEYDNADKRVQQHRDLAEVAAQERDVYSAAIADLSKSLKVLAKIQQDEISEKTKEPKK